jgi:hypothetical protein
VAAARLAPCQAFSLTSTSSTITRRNRMYKAEHEWAGSGPLGMDAICMEIARSWWTPCKANRDDSKRLASGYVQ